MASPPHPASRRCASHGLPLGQKAAFDVRPSCHGWARSPAPRRRIHLYRFLLNGFRSFDSLSKVLFIFPSQYLFAIGFPHIFSLRRSLSPAWCTSIKVHDSPRTCQVPSDTTDGALTLFGGSLRSTSASDKVRQALFRLQFAVQGRRLPFWAFPASVAPTEGILVSFFSSA